MRGNRVRKRKTAKSSTLGEIKLRQTNVATATPLGFRSALQNRSKNETPTIRAEPKNGMKVEQSYEVRPVAMGVSGTCLLSNAESVPSLRINVEFRRLTRRFPRRVKWNLVLDRSNQSVVILM